jgi:hypothetical protein
LNLAERCHRVNGPQRLPPDDQIQRVPPRPFRRKARRQPAARGIAPAPYCRGKSRTSTASVANTSAWIAAHPASTASRLRHIKTSLTERKATQPILSLACCARPKAAVGPYSWPTGVCRTRCKPSQRVCLPRASMLLFTNFRTGCTNACNSCLTNTIAWDKHRKGPRDVEKWRAALSWIL